MALNHIPTQFRVDSEEDLRFAVASYFVELGFELDELSFEDQFHIRLGHTEVVVNKDLARRDVRGRSDLLLTRNSRPVAIVETKSPDHEINDEDAWQAISYARLLNEIAPYSIVTNGRTTKVYDTLAPRLETVDDPSTTSWATGGQCYASIGQDLRYEAEKTLVGVNPETLHRLCRSQVSNALADLRGNINEQKKYVPELYVARDHLADEVAAWLRTDRPFFAIVGESGFGKTNIACATAERMVNEEYVLFYSASRLTGGLLEAIRNDFVWEFRRDRDIAYVVDRFDDISVQSGKKIVVFIDGLDEYNGDLDILKAELLEVASRIGNRPTLRFFISCKRFDWPRFIIDNGQVYNRLARSVYPTVPEVHQPKSLTHANAERVGFQVESFSDEELSKAIPLYKREFALTGDFRGALWKECHNPLMLRFVSEIYGGRSTELPLDITSRELFELYWNRRLTDIRNRNSAERILITLANIAFTNGTHQVLLDDLLSALTWNEGFEDALNDLQRWGVLTINTDANQYKWIGFYFGKFLLYTFAVKAERWLLSTPNDVAAKMAELVGSRLGVEAIEFYISTIDHGESGILTQLALLVHSQGTFSGMVRWSS